MLVPKQTRSKRGHSEKAIKPEMVLCVVFGCGIPSVATNKGEFEEELTTERREKWMKAISRGDTESKDVLNSERVCGKHFVSGETCPKLPQCNLVPRVSHLTKDERTWERGWRQ